MSSPFNQSQIDLPLATPPMIGRYDKPIAAGMATRFVKGTSGNPDGRPSKRSLLWTQVNWLTICSSFLIRAEIPAPANDWDALVDPVLFIFYGGAFYELSGFCLSLLAGSSYKGRPD